MGQVLIRNLDDQILADWREIAAANGRSLEAELREALRRAKPLTPSKLKQVQEESARMRAMTPDVPRESSEALLRRYRNGGDDED
jgi:plasmid stability protein